jgi:hypothetical protein
LADIEIPKLLRWILTGQYLIHETTRKDFCVKVWKSNVFSRKVVVFFPVVLKMFPKLPYFVVAKELYNQEQRVVD